MNVDELVVKSDVMPSSSSMAPPTQRPRARQRAQLSCDRCRRLKRKCDRSAPCSECRAIGTRCTFDRAQQTSSALADSRERRKAARRRSAWPDSSPIKFNTDQIRSPSDGGAGTSRSSSMSTGGGGSSGSGGSINNGIGTTPVLYSLSSSTAAPAPPLYASPFNASNSDSSPASVGENGYGSSSSGATTWTSPDVVTSVSSPSSASLSEIENLVREPAFFERIMATWYRELEWASDAIRNSPFDRVMVKNRASIGSQAHMDRFKGLLFGIVAMCSLIVPTDVESILVSMSNARSRHGFYSAESLGQAAHAAAGRWLEEKAKRSSVEGWGVEAFQASLVHGMFIKYSGNWNVYREHSSRDMDRLHRAGYHRLPEMAQNENLSDDEIAARYAVFWRYFSFDRIASLFDGIPYTIQARNADTWLFTATENIHIRTLCRDSGAGDPLNGIMAHTCPLKPSLISTLRTVLTPYTLMMIQLAALAGRCSDRLNSMTQASLADNYIRAEHIAAETDDELQLLEQGIKMDDFDVFQRPMITMTITRIRRDVTTRLSRHIAKQHRAAPNGEEALVQTLNRRCLNTAKSLIRRVTGVAGPTPVRAIATPFFTLFVAETMMELLTEVEEAAKSSSPPGLLDFEAQDDLKHALIARNFLALLARMSEIALNKMIAYKACLQVQTVLQQCVPAKDAHTYQHVMEITRIFDPDVVISTISAPRQQLEEGSPQRAEDVLNLLGSLTSLQRIFEMGGQTWSN